jgi:hypothetical protein
LEIQGRDVGCRVADGSNAFELTIQELRNAGIGFAKPGPSQSCGTIIPQSLDSLIHRHGRLR